MEVLFLYWLFSSLFMCSIFADDWKEHPLKGFFISFGLGWFMFPIYLGITYLNR